MKVLLGRLIFGGSSTQPVNSSENATAVTKSFDTQIISQSFPINIVKKGFSVYQVVTECSLKRGKVWARRSGRVSPGSFLWIAQVFNHPVHSPVNWVRGLSVHIVFMGAYNFGQCCSTVSRDGPHVSYQVLAPDMKLGA
jgi:hypothetical protein